MLLFFYYYHCYYQNFLFYKNIFTESNYLQLCSDMDSCFIMHNTKKCNVVYLKNSEGILIFQIDLTTEFCNNDDSCELLCWLF